MASPLPRQGGESPCLRRFDEAPSGQNGCKKYWLAESARFTIMFEIDDFSESLSYLTCVVPNERFGYAGRRRASSVPCGRLNFWLGVAECFLSTAVAGDRACQSPDMFEEDIPR